MGILKLKPDPPSAPTKLKLKDEGKHQAPPPKRPQRAKAYEPGQKLPQAGEIEKALLGAILQNPEVGFPAFQRSARTSFFFNPINREIYSFGLRFYTENGTTDLIALTAELSDSGKIEKLGGAGYLTDLFTGPAGVGYPSHMMDYYIEQLRDKYVRRRAMTSSFGIAKAAAEEDDVSAVIARMARDADDLSVAVGMSQNGHKQFDLDKLLEFNPKMDPDCLVGYRWLNRGGASLWAGGSGYGKSSLEMQLAIYWACGEACFGLRPVRSLKSLIIQAENDEGDTAEQLQGVLKGIDSSGTLDLEGHRDQIKRNIIIYRVIGSTGGEFLGFLDNQIQVDKPDLVWIDPLFAFAGCDLLNPEKTGRFLREGLFPIADKRRVCMCVLHHIGKPPREQPGKNGNQMSELDYQYLGFGTSEIQNAFRSVNILVPVKKGGGFKLVFSKRGERAGAKDFDGQWAREIFIEHSKHGICWIQKDAPEVEDESGRKFTAQDVLDEMSVTNPVKTDTVRKRVYNEKNMSRPTFFRFWNRLMTEKRIKQVDKGWVKDNSPNETLASEVNQSQNENETKNETSDETFEGEQPF